MDPKLTNRTMFTLARHIGEENAIGMGELYERVYGKEWRNRINDSRPIRAVITGLRREGVPVCSVSDRTKGGYFLAAAGSELEDYLARVRSRALKALVIESKIRRVSMPELLGQMRLELGGDDDTH